MSDDAGVYPPIVGDLAGHGTVNHSAEEYVRLAEFDFRYNERMGLGVNDKQRAAKMLKGIMGKRLTYRRTRSATSRPSHARIMKRLRNSRRA